MAEALAAAGVHYEVTPGRSLCGGGGPVSGHMGDVFCVRCLREALRQTGERAEELHHQAAVAVAEEREACARVAESGDYQDDWVQAAVAKAIRARGKS